MFADTEPVPYQGVQKQGYFGLSSKYFDHGFLGQHGLIMLHEKLTEDIIGSAMKVLNELRPGLDEKLYERALALELVKRGHQVE